MDKLHYVAAIPRIDGSSSIEDARAATIELVDAIADNWDGPVAPRVRLLPPVLPAHELPAPEGRLRLPLGLGEADLEPVWHDFAAQPHLTVVGDTGSGKTAVARLIATTLAGSCRPEDTRIVLYDPRRALYDAVPETHRRGVAFSSAALAELIAPLAAELTERQPGADISPAQLARRDWWTGPDYYVIVDDYDMVVSGGYGDAEPLDGLLPLLSVASDVGLHLVVTRSAATSSRLMSNAVMRRLQESNTPDVVLSCPPSEGPMLNGQRPRLLPPGRAQLVTRRSATLLQVGWTPEPEQF